jgi:pyruvate,water dikinase
LQDKEIIELATIAKEIEKHYGCAMDIEWAIDKDFSFPESVFIVQARPETVWSQRRKKPVAGKRSAFDLILEKAAAFREQPAGES